MNEPTCAFCGSTGPTTSYTPPAIGYTADADDLCDVCLVAMRDIDSQSLAGRLAELSAAMRRLRDDAGTDARIDQATANVRDALRGRALRRPPRSMRP